MDTKTEFCWLIETDNGAPIEYLEDANYGEKPIFTEDPYKARRFYSKKSSDCVAGVLSTDHDLDLRSVEHGFDTTNLTKETSCVKETAKTLHVDIMPDELWVNKSNPEPLLHGVTCWRTTTDRDISPINTVKYIRADIVHDITRAHLKCLAQATPAPIEAEAVEAINYIEAVLDEFFPKHTIKPRIETIRAALKKGG